MLAEAAGAHPADSKDFKEGGSSWSGSSPYRAPLGYEPATVHPHQPQSWGLATGAEPWRESALLERMTRKGRKTDEDKPSVRYYAKNDPCDPLDPEKKIFSQTPEPHHVPGYSGFMPGVIAESIFGQTYAQASHMAQVRRAEAEARPTTRHVSLDDVDPKDGVLPFQPRGDKDKRHSEFKTTARPDKDVRIHKHIPGYTGFIPGVLAESMYGKTFSQQSITAIEGDKKRFHFTALEPSEQYVTDVKDAFRNFGRDVPQHLGPNHEDANSSRMPFMTASDPTRLVDDKVHFHMPGYGGFVPGVYSRNMYGKTFFKASDMALTEFEKQQAAMPRPQTAPEKPPVFKSFIPTLRMQDTGLKAKNKSSLQMADAQKMAPEEYRTMSELEFGPKDRLLKTPYPKNPLPDFIHFDRDMAHPSMYNGYHAR